MTPLLDLIAVANIVRKMTDRHCYSFVVLTSARLGGDDNATEFATPLSRCLDSRAVRCNRKTRIVSSRTP